ncbi:MAG: hypothetical protein ABFS43_13985 [Thermodesulfobacteriota bacterium]
MHTKDTLGIIVNSNRYFDFITHLAEAAADHDKAVRIHLLGDGCEFVITDACTRLSRRARVTMCEKSARQMAQGVLEGVKDRILLVPPQELTRLLQQCGRYVVF